jgi:hypothetical protein
VKRCAAVLLCLCAATTARAEKAAQCRADGGSNLTGTVTAGPSFSRGHPRRGVELSHTHLRLLSAQDGQSYDAAMDVFANGFDSAGEGVPPPLSSIHVGDRLALCGQLHTDGRAGIHFVRTNCGDSATATDPDGWVKPIAENRIPDPDLDNSREYCGAVAGEPCSDAWRGQLSPIRSAAMKADCGMSTWPNWRIRFLPAFCFSNSFRFRVTSPP